MFCKDKEDSDPEGFLGARELSPKQAEESTVLVTLFYINSGHHRGK